MQPRVRRLEGPLIDQIAAGEVVERPASVAKELLENAIDAGARSITLDLEDGGRGRIRVADDGHGMLREDALVAIERHATSKITTEADLHAIRTLGFRGEALPSIASVSRFTLTTRTADSPIGTEIRIEGGVVSPPRDVGTAPGTIVDVESLFFNVPARLKFLRSRATESGAVYDVALRVALANSALRLVVRHDGRVVHTYLPARSLHDRATTALPNEVLSPVLATHDGISIDASLSAPERAKSGARGLHLFVNGRPVDDIRLARAIAFAFGSVIPPGRYPIGVVHVVLPLDEVDVNAHPQKTEVRFARGSAFYEGVTRALSRELGTRAFGGPSSRGNDYWDSRLGGRIPTNEAPRERPHEHSDVEAFARALAHGGPTGTSGAPVSPTPRPYPPIGRPMEVPSVPATPAPLVSRAADSESMPIPSLAPRGYFGSLRFVGQVRKTYLVCEGDTGLVLLDQHAVDERIVYHRMRSSLAGAEVKTQRLLFPERVEVDARDAEFIEGRADLVASTGLECTRLGPTTIAVHAVPSLLARAKPSTLVRDLLAELSHEGERTFGDALDTAIATMACHASIRAGDTLSPAECVALLHALDEVDAFAGHCPHGRPVVTTLAFDDLAKKLGRS